VNGEGCLIHQPFPFHHFPTVIHKQEILRRQARKVSPKGIHPEVIRALRIPRRDVPRSAFVEAVEGEKTKGRRQAHL
jgi:hypothetical protein